MLLRRYASVHKPSHAAANSSVGAAPGINRARSRIAAAAAAASDVKQPRGEDRSHETDVVVIGSGIGGLSCAGMLAKYGYEVTVCESHSVPGGAAHTWERGGYHFESGPSLYSGMDARGVDANPMAHVFQAIGEELELKRYDTWNVIVPEGTFLTRVGNDNFTDVLEKIYSPGHPAIAEWANLQEKMRPLAKAATMMPPAAFRFDLGVFKSAFGRYLGDLVTAGPTAMGLTKPFSSVLDQHVKDPFIYNWLDLLCFLLSGMPASGTIAAEMAFMFNEWYKPNSCLDFPVGGSEAMVAALVRGVTKRPGGKVWTNSHVEQVVMKDGKAAGVKLRGGGTIMARTAVVCNASAWDSLKLLPPGTVPEQYRRSCQDMPQCNSFMHLHIGFDKTGLPDDLELHHIIVNSWDDITAEQNVVLISIASVIDPSLAPEGKHCLHAYLPATEPYAKWANVKRGSPEYKALKEERSQVLWQAVEKIIPDIRERAEFSCVGTPLTHESFLRRDRGAYGPAIKAGDALFPGPSTPIKGLYACGDCTFPGIGLPAVAASGTICANTLVPLEKHIAMLDEIGV